MVASWVIIGLTEEIVFQGLFHSFLRRYWPEVLCWHGLYLPMTGVLTALLFALSHMQLSIAPPMRCPGLSHAVNLGFCSRATLFGHLL